MKYVIDAEGRFKREYVAGSSVSAGCMLVETDAQPTPGDVFVNGVWVQVNTMAKPPEEPEQFDGTVSATRFLRDLLTFPTYGAMEVAETGLAAKFANGGATAADIQLLGIFRAAKVWINTSATINLNDPMVSTVLDACIAIPAIGMTADDKHRILRNAAKT